MENDPAYLALLERFKSVLGGPDLTGNPPASPNIPANEAVGEKRARGQEESEQGTTQAKKKKRHSGDWFVVVTYSHIPRKQRYIHNTSDFRIDDHISRGLEKGLYITSVSSAHNFWALMLDAHTGYINQIYHKTPGHFDKDWIIQRWKENFFITAVACARDSGSFTVMSQGGNDFTLQAFKSCNSSFPVKWLRKKWREGFFLTSMACNGKRWFIVVTRTSLFQDQNVEFDCDYSPNRIERLRSRGFEITAAASSKKQKAVVLSMPQNRLAASQAVLVSPSFPGEKIKDSWAKHHYVTCLGYNRANHYEKTPMKVTRNFL